MPGSPVSQGRTVPTGPTLHDLPPIKYGEASVPLQVEVWRAEDATWRGRLLFGAADAGERRSTTEIFCAASEGDLWEAVHDLREHHLRDLYRSLAE